MQISLRAYFLWLLAVEAVVVGLSWNSDLLRQTLGLNLPVSALLAFTPFLVAAILIWRQHGMKAVGAYALRAIDWGRARNPLWFLVAVVAMPAALLATYLLMRFAGQPLPDAGLNWGAIAPMILLFAIPAATEELGWQAIAYDQLRENQAPLQAGLMVGLFWAVWHFVPFLQTGHALPWVLFHAGNAVLQRLLTAAIYERTDRSAFSSLLFHTFSNVAFYAFPVAGSAYDPAFLFPILLVACVVVAATGGLGWRKS